MASPSKRSIRLNPAAREDAQCFALTLETDPGLPYAECRQLERCLEDYAEAHGLQLLGHQLHQLVCAPNRPVSVNDQVALIDWVIDLPGLVAVRLGPIVPMSEAPQAPEEGVDDDAFVQVRAGDVALIGLTLLYRCGRIAPSLYLQILGGYVRPASTH